MQCESENPKVTDYLFEEPSQPSVSSPGHTVKEATAKRKISSASPGPTSCQKSQRLISPPKSRMSSEEVKKLTLDVVSVQTSLDIIVKQGAETLALSKETRTDMAAMDKETKAMIEMNTRGLEDFKAYQIAQNNTVDARLSGVETEVAAIKGLIESGKFGSLEGEPRGYNHEVEHESNLKSMITKSNSCVTMLGAEDQEWTPKKVILAMTKSYPAHGIPEAAIFGAARIGSAANKHPPCKVEVSSPAIAESLIELSRVRARKHRSENTGDPMPEGVRFVKHFPQAYAQVAKAYKTMQTEVFNNGGLAAIVYEGTTLTLQAKSKAPGGQWLIMRGCEFRLLAVGRQVPQDSDTDGMANARALLDSVLDNRPNSVQARSLHLNTKMTLGTLTIIKAKIGASLSEGLLKGDLKEKLSTKNIYTLTYSTREEAIKALQTSRKLSELTDCSMVDGSDWLTHVVPVCAP